MKIDSYGLQQCYANCLVEIPEGKDAVTHLGARIIPREYYALARAASRNLGFEVPASGVRAALDNILAGWGSYLREARPDAVRLDILEVDGKLKAAITPYRKEDEYAWPMDDWYMVAMGDIIQ